jgi:hypothetical protein
MQTRIAEGRSGGVKCLRLSQLLLLTLWSIRCSHPRVPLSRMSHLKSQPQEIGRMKSVIGRRALPGPAIHQKIRRDLANRVS